MKNKIHHLFILWAKSLDVYRKRKTLMYLNIPPLPLAIQGDINEHLIYFHSWNCFCISSKKSKKSFLSVHPSWIDKINNFKINSFYNFYQSEAVLNTSKNLHENRPKVFSFQRHNKQLAVLILPCIRISTGYGGTACVAMSKNGSTS